MVRKTQPRMFHFVLPVGILSCNHRDDSKLQNMEMIIPLVVDLIGGRQLDPLGGNILKEILQKSTKTFKFKINACLDRTYCHLQLLMYKALEVEFTILK